MQKFETFVGHITQLYRSIQRIKRLEMSELGLRGAHVMFLSKLAQSPQGLTSAELCAECGEDKAATSRTAAELESRGYIERENGAKYRSKLRLTEQGKCVAQRVLQRIEAAEELGGEGLSDAQRESFNAALSLIDENLQRLCDEMEDKR